MDCAGFYAPCSHAQISTHLSLLFESLPLELSELATVQPGARNRNKCSVPGTLYNTNTLEAYQIIDKQSLLRSEAMKVMSYNYRLMLDFGMLFTICCLPLFFVVVCGVEQVVSF